MNELEKQIEAEANKPRWVDDLQSYPAPMIFNIFSIEHTHSLFGMNSGSGTKVSMAHISNPHHSHAILEGMCSVPGPDLMFLALCVHMGF